MAKREGDDEEGAEVRDFTSKVRRNPWMAATIILAIAVIVVIGFSLKGTTGTIITEKQAGEKVVGYINSLSPDNQVSYVSSKDFGNFYEVKVSYKGEDLPVYVSKDGKYWTSMMQSLQSSNSTANNQAAEVVKSNRPVVEAFVFSYCPYGLQFEKALLPVYTLLKNRADIKLVFIGAMHGQYEETESLRQICIKKEYSNDKLFSYLDRFSAKKEIGDCNGVETCSLPYVKTIMTGLGIDEAKINACMSGDGKTLYQADMARAQQLGVSGSPTFVINNAPATVGRSPAAVLQAVCSAFNTIPTECKQTLSTESATAGFGTATTSASATGSAAQC